MWQKQAEITGTRGGSEDGQGGANAFKRSATTCGKVVERR